MRNYIRITYKKNIFVRGRFLEAVIKCADRVEYRTLAIGEIEKTVNKEIDEKGRLAPPLA